MTKFDELMELISRNKSKKNIPKKGSFAEQSSSKNDNEDIDIEVTGTDATSAPLITSADDSLDPDLTDMLYTKRGWRNVPLRGENASSWDSDY